jgi:hypothetical protein
VIRLVTGNERAVLNSQYVLKKAEKAPFRIMITENGTVDSMRNAVLSNRVEGSTTIISLVPEGSKVNAPWSPSLMASFNLWTVLRNHQRPSAWLRRRQKKIYEVVLVNLPKSL